MKYLFLDTNIYLHYNDIGQIDWKSLLTINEDFCIVVPHIVVREIDNQKDNSKGKLQKRAKMISSKFANVFLDGKFWEDSIQVITCNEPQSNCYSLFQLDPRINDDVILASALTFVHGTSDVIIVSGDNGLLIKSKAKGLSFFKMPDQSRLKEEPTEMERELNKVKTELEEYKKKTPILSISFKNNQLSLQIKRPPIVDIEKILEDIVEREKKRVPYKDYQVLSHQKISSLLSLQKSAYEQYNSDLDCYYKDFRDYEELVLKHDFMEECFHELKFYINNEGTAQTGDVNIFIEIPSIIFLYNDESMKVIEAIAPVLPRIGTSYSLLDELNKMKGDSMINRYVPKIEIRDINKKIEIHDINISISKLNHHLTRPLDVNHSLFIDAMNTDSFRIKWMIIDSSIPNPVSGILNVDIID